MGTKVHHRGCKQFVIVLAPTASLRDELSLTQKNDREGLEMIVAVFVNHWKWDVEGGIGKIRVCYEVAPFLDNVNEC